jgi:hypothetical protein
MSVVIKTSLILLPLLFQCTVCSFSSNWTVPISATSGCIIARNVHLILGVRSAFVHALFSSLGPCGVCTSGRLGYSRGTTAWKHPWNSSLHSGELAHWKPYLLPALSCTKLRRTSGSLLMFYLNTRKIRHHNTYGLCPCEILITFKGECTHLLHAKKKPAVTFTDF